MEINTEMKKILVLETSSDITGALKAILLNATALRDEFDFSFILPYNSKAQEIVEAHGFKTLNLNYAVLSRRIKDMVSYLPRLLCASFRLVAVIREGGFNIVHVNDLNNLHAVIPSRINKVSVITHIRQLRSSTPDFLYNTWSYIHRRTSNQLIAVSPACIEDLSEKTANRTVIIPDPLPSDESLPPYQVKDNMPLRVLYLSNFTTGKGHDHVLSVLKILDAQESLSFAFDFVGGDLGMIKNQELKKELELECDLVIKNIKIKFREKVEDIEALMKSFDIVLNLSDSESFSYTCLESLFYGIPLVASDSGGPKYLFEDGRSGILVPRADAETAAKALMNLYFDLKLRVSLSLSSREEIRKRLSFERTHQALRKIYSAL